MAAPELPFELTIKAGALAQRDGLRITLVAQPDDLSEPLTGEEYSGSLAALNLFDLCVNAQFFVAEPGGPAALMQADRCAWQESKQACVWEGRAQDVPVQAWVYLIALLSKSHDCLEPLGRVVLEGGSSLALPQWPVMFEAVSEDFDVDHYPFEASAPGVDGSRNLLLEMEFRDDIDEAQAEQVKELCSLWQQLNILGAFDLTFGEAEDLDPMSEAHQISPIRMNCMIPYFSGHLSGLQILFNMVAHVHAEIAELEEVEFG